MFKKIKEFFFGAETPPEHIYDSHDNSHIIMPLYIRPNLFIRIKDSIRSFIAEHHIAILTFIGVLCAIIALYLQLS